MKKNNDVIWSRIIREKTVEPDLNFLKKIEPQKKPSLAKEMFRNLIIKILEKL